VLEIAGRLLATLTAGHRVAVATVVSMTGSAPTVVGTSMAVDDTGAALGSVAGGCVEGALYDLCTSVLGGAAPGVQEYGVTDEDAFAVGLTCGGVLRVHARELGTADLPALAAASRGEEVVLVTALDGPLPDEVPVLTRSGLVRVQGPDGGVEVFVEVAAAPPRSSTARSSSPLRWPSWRGLRATA
jgi:xanthine dehydrogenase accessory factor